MTDLVLTEHHDGGVALLRLNRPPMNPLSIALLGEPSRRRECARIGSRRQGGGRRRERKGARGGRRHQRALTDQRRARASTGALSAAPDAVASIPRPVIAAIRGCAPVAAASSRFTCDLRRRRARGSVSLRSSWASSPAQGRNAWRGCSAPRAPRSSCERPLARADEALGAGILDRVVPADEVGAGTALHWAAQLEGCGRDGARQACDRRRFPARRWREALMTKRTRSSR